MLNNLRRILFAGLLILAMCSSAIAAQSPETQPSRSLFTRFVVAGGPIVWFILIPMSIAAVALIIEHSFVIRRKVLMPEGSARRIAMLLSTRSLSELPHALSRRPDLLSVAVTSVITHAAGARNTVQPREMLVEALQERALHLNRKIEWLNLLGNVSPMVGLFGTVVGTITALDALSQSGGLASAPKLAGGISVALVTTYWGLLIAIPALAAHGIFRNRIEIILGEAAAEAETLVPHLSLPLAPRPAVAPDRPAAPSAGASPSQARDALAETSP